MSRLFSIIRHKPGLVDLITPIVNWTLGIDGYRLKTDTDPGGAFATTVLTTTNTGYVDPAVAGNQHVIVPGENVRMVFKPSTFNLPDNGAFWLKLLYLSGGVEQSSPAPSAPTLILPPYTAPIQTGFTATAPHGADIAHSLQIDLPRAMENMRIRNLDSANSLSVAFDAGGPEVTVPFGQETVAFSGVVTSLWVRGTAGTISFTTTFTYAFPR
jgi:hypothetical protein